MFHRKMAQMQQCEKEGYECELCESLTDCSTATTWTCDCCGKKVSFSTCKKIVKGVSLKEKQNPRSLPI